MREYQASHALIALIHRLAGTDWHAVPDAPGDWDTVRQQDPNGHIVVSSEYSDSSIYGSPENNHAFRAWHDRTHLRLDRGFDDEGEYYVGNAQVNAVHRARHDDTSLRNEDAMAIYYDTIGQIEYRNTHYGAFPTNQRAFVQSCFDIGLAESIKLAF